MGSALLEPAGAAAAGAAAGAIAPSLSVAEAAAACVAGAVEEADGCALTIDQSAEHPAAPPELPPLSSLALPVLAVTSAAEALTPAAGRGALLLSRMESSAADPSPPSPKRHVQAAAAAAAAARTTIDGCGWRADDAGRIVVRVTRMHSCDSAEDSGLQRARDALLQHHLGAEAAARRLGAALGRGGAAATGAWDDILGLWRAWESGPFASRARAQAEDVARLAAIAAWLLVGVAIVVAGSWESSPHTHSAGDGGRA
jgi:hypothetical protein